MSYTVIVETRSLTSFEARVREHMLNGWVPQGGVCVENTNFYQAMVYAPRPTSEQIDKIREDK